MSFLIKVADERGAQLQAFAEAQGIGTAAAIGVLLKRAGAADAVPGFTILAILPQSAEPLFQVGFDGFACHLLRELVAEIATQLDRSSSTAGGAKKLAIDSKLGSFEITVARLSGHSVVIVGRDLQSGVEATRTLTLDLARDLAEQLRRAIA